jgi:hypothetical protein
MESHEFAGKMYDALRKVDFEYSAMSWGGMNIFGDTKSINYVRNAVHYYEQREGFVRYYQENINALNAKIQELTDKLNKIKGMCDE